MAIAVLGSGAPGLAQTPPSTPPRSSDPSATSYVVFLGSRPVGREEVSVLRQADGWAIRGVSRIGAPVEVVTRAAEIRYDGEWRARSMTLEGTVRGVETSVKTTFADGKATSEITVKGEVSTKTDDVSADAVVLPNAFLGSYAALARRLVDAAVGTTVRAYIAPQAELPIRIESKTAERIDTPQQAISATRVSMRMSNPGGELQLNAWIDAAGALLRLSVPAQMLELARDDIASAASRTTSFSLPGDEAIRIAATGFNLAGTVTKPPDAREPLPALVLIGGAGPTDRDGFAAGIPVVGQIAGDLVRAGFLVVRYDKRGVGQSGGRAEAATLTDYAEDVRSVITWLRDRDDVDDRRIGLVGHSEGAWVAMLAASRDDRVSAMALVAAAASTGAELVLEQQRHVLERLKASEPEAEEKVALQKQINEAALTGKGWDQVPAEVRAQAETPWFQSFLAFDPAKVMKDVDQPVLIVHGALDAQVPPVHAEKLAALARARGREEATDVVLVPGINHLLVPATTGEIDEYGSLTDRSLAPAVTAAIGSWMAKELGPGKR
ncbi:MAG: alpha/beta hydrolase family protein [Vicinamibacterales bacterium]